MELAQELKRRKALEALLESGAPAESFEKHFRLIENHLMRDDDLAQFYMPTLVTIADRGFATANLHVSLFYCYRTGRGIEPSAVKALEHIHLAMAMGSKTAVWWYANALRNNEGLEGVLEKDLGEALRLYRRLADANDGSTSQSLALPYAIDIMIENKRAIDCSPEYVAAVDRYVQDGETCRVLFNRHYHALAIFYTDGLESTDYAGREYAKARKLLIEGLKAREETVRAECQRLLEAWKQIPVPEPDVTFSSLSVAEKTAVFSIPFILIFWALVSSALLAVVSAISIPFGLFLLVGLLVFGLSKLGKKQAKP